MKDVKLAYEAMEWSIGGLILCAGKVLDKEEGFAHLWGPSNQVFSPHLERQSNDWGMWAATMNSSQDLFQEAIIIRSVDHAFKTYEWTLSDLDLKIIGYFIPSSCMCLWRQLATHSF
jgi:hypothetical protein